MDEPSTRAGGNPPLPLADTHKARVDAVYGWYLEQIALDGVNPDTAAHRAIEAATPHLDRTPLPFGAKVIRAVLSVVVFSLLIPAVLWTVGHGVVPLWVWGTSWM